MHALYILTMVSMLILLHRLQDPMGRIYSTVSRLKDYGCNPILMATIPSTKDKNK